MYMYNDTLFQEKQLSEAKRPIKFYQGIYLMTNINLASKYFSTQIISI